MRNAGAGLLCVIILALSISALPFKTSANDWKIIPGERIGDASLAMSMDDVLKTLGTPTDVTRLPRMTRYEWANQRIRILQSQDTGLISSIHTYWLAPTGRAAAVPTPYRTDKGVGIWATPEEVRRAYGDAGCLERERRTPQGREFLWRAEGIFFVIATDVGAPQEIRNKVRDIGIQQKGGQTPDSGPEYTPCK